jgi:hypothetical protein
LPNQIKVKVRSDQKVAREIARIFAKAGNSVNAVKPAISNSHFVAFGVPPSGGPQPSTA